MESIQVISTLHYIPHKTGLPFVPASGIDPADRVFFLGRLVKDKGINELVSAFLRLEQQRKNLKLLLVGDYEQELDPLLPETMEHIRSHPQIIGTGFQKM